MEILEDLVAAYRVLAEYRVIDAYGHVSMRSPDNPQRYFIARSLAAFTLFASCDRAGRHTLSNPANRTGAQQREVAMRFIV